MSLVKQGTNFPFIIVAPQCPAGELWDNEPLLQLLDRMTDKYSVDTNRIYLTGLSMGGYGTWKLGLSHPDKFAAIAPICGGASMIDVILGTWDKKKELEKLPVWAFHGAEDGAVKPKRSRDMIAALKKAGGSPRYTEYEKVGHNSWEKAYGEEKMHDWLFGQKRSE